MIFKYPYTDMHELNLDWILQKINELSATISNFISHSTIKWAEPAEWVISSAYEANTLVLYKHMIYISTKAVPQNTMITDTNYWLPLMEYTKPDTIIYTPQMFGAVGDGVADDTEPFGRAMEYCISNNIDTLFLYGHYKINASNMLINHLRLEGIGEAIITDIYRGSDPLFIFYDKSNIIVNGGMKNLKIISNAAHTGSIITACNYNQIDFHNLTLWYGAYGITLLSTLPSSFKALINDVSFNNQSEAGLLCDTGEDGGWVSDVYMSNVLISNCKEGMRIKNVSGLYCSNLDIIHCNTGLRIDSSEHSVESCYFVNSLFDTSKYDNAAINEHTMTYNECRSIFFTNCWFSNSTNQRGMVAREVFDLKISNCEFLFNKMYGLFVGNCTRACINANAFRGNSLNSHACMLFRQSHDSIITSNNFGGRGTGAFADYISTKPIQMESCSNSIISSNVSNDNTNNDMTISGDYSTDLIKNNIGIIDR